MPEEEVVGTAPFFLRVEEESAVYAEKTVFIYDCPVLWVGDESDDDDGGGDDNEDGDNENDTDNDDEESTNDEGQSHNEEENYNGDERSNGDESTGIKEEHLTLGQLRSKLEDLDAEHVIRLDICCESLNTWKRLTDDYWEQFCRTIQKCLPCLKTLNIEHTYYLSDHQWACLLLHMPAQLSTLTLSDIRISPLSFQQIGISLKMLQELVLVGDFSVFDPVVKCLPPDCCQIIADSLEELTVLRRLTIGNMRTINPKESWAPVLKSIRKNARLEQVRFDPGWTRENNNVVRYPLDPQVMEDLQFGPRLQQAKRQYLSGHPETLTIEQWVGALISVRDRIDCLDYLICEMDPHLFARQVLSSSNEARVRSEV